MSHVFCRIARVGMAEAGVLNKVAHFLIKGKEWSETADTLNYQCDTIKVTIIDKI